METAASKTIKLDDEELKILNELFFVSSFEQILSNSSLNEAEIEKIIIKLIKNDLVNQMIFDDKIKDYVGTKSAANVQSRFYVITKKGLSNHIYG